MTIGFIGLGKMGTGIARNLLAAGHELRVYNRTPSKAEALGKERVTVAASPAEAAKGADAVFTMLSDDDALSKVVWGENGLTAGLQTNAIHISSSTVSVALAKRLTAEHGARQQGFVSAPVFGRPDAAEAKKLLVVLAGGAAMLERCRPLAEAIGRRTFVAGSEPWQANVVKLSGNFMIASMLESFAEAFAVMGKAGIEAHEFLDVMVELFGSPVYKNYGTNVADRKFEPAGFELKLGLKDVKLALAAAEDLGAPMRLASVIRDQFVSAMAHSQEKMDWSSLALVAAREAALEDTKPR